MITFELPRLPPSTNQLFIEVEGDVVMHQEGGKVVMKAGPRKRIKAQPYRQWRDEMGWEIRRQVRTRISGPVVFIVECVKPEHRRRDASNLLKALEDICVHLGIMEDDSMVMDSRSRWVRQGPPCRVTIVSSPAELDPLDHSTL